MPELPDNWWRDKATFQSVLAECGDNNHEVARRYGVGEAVIRKWRQRHGLAPSIRRGSAEPRLMAVPVEETDDAWIIAAAKKHGYDLTIEQLADLGDTSPRRVRAALDRLRTAGYRIGESGEKVVLTKVVPEANRSFTASPALFDGDLLRVGIVSDTHLGSNEEALDELHAAYDVFAAEGINEVWHAGDWGTGVDVFKTHHSEAHVHTGTQQVDYLEEHYPRRDGIITRGISGNHDLEGAFGRVGFDPVSALAARRDDIDYLGEYGAWIEIRPGCWLHLLHGSGGMSYAFSYKAQKLVDGYQGGRKPNALIVGHWHVRADIEARNVKVLFPGCFEWQSPFMQRKGLQPAVGFHILEARIADDGSIVRWKPEWFSFYAGRRVVA